jgi:hypothetical protein
MLGPGGPVDTQGDTALHSPCSSCVTYRGTGAGRNEHIPDTALRPEKRQVLQECRGGMTAAVTMETALKDDLGLPSRDPLSDTEQDFSLKCFHVLM